MREANRLWASAIRSTQGQFCNNRRQMGSKILQKISENSVYSLYFVGINQVHLVAVWEIED